MRIVYYSRRVLYPALLSPRPTEVAVVGKHTVVQKRRMYSSGPGIARSWEFRFNGLTSGLVVGVGVIGRQLATCNAQ
jgi:hypothetical protein